MTKPKRVAEKAWRRDFDAWAKVRAEQSPGDWVLTNGHDGEEHWAWEAWKGCAGKYANRLAVLEARVRELEAAATAAQVEPGALALTPELRELIALALGGGGGRVYYDDRGFNDYTTCTACHATGAGDLSDGELKHKPGCSLVAKQEAAAKLLKLAAAPK